MMRLLAIILLLTSKAFATTYFVKTAGGTGAGTSDATAWSEARWNSTGRTIVVAGDVVQFKSGDTFGQLLLPTANGTSGNPITLTTYGTGAKPIFNTLTTLSSWTLSSGNIYYTTVDVPRLQIVTVDGALQGMGRYPKTGYFTIGSHSGLSTVTSTSIGSIPFDPAGGEFVTRKARFIIDRHNITSRSGNTLNITAPSDFGPTGNYALDDGNGFFIQNALGTLTQLGDWYYDNAANRLYMHFGAGNSSSHVIQASLVDEAANVQSKAYITLNNLDFRGGNIAGVNALYSNNITVTNCNIAMTTEGVWAANGGVTPSSNMLFSGNYIANTFSNGICTDEVENVSATNNTIRNIHMVPGMGRSGDAIGNGLSVTGGDNMILSGNRINNVGYCGIAEYAGVSGGDNVFIENNIVDTFSVNKDDAGGLYMYGGSAQTFANRRIKNNWVKNGIGNVEGVSNLYATLPFAVAVYLDNYATNVNVENNLLTDNSGAGVFFNSTNTDTIANNTIYNNGFFGFLLLSRASPELVHDLYVHHNKFIAKTATQALLEFEMYNSPSTISTIGTFNNNTFYRPFGNTSYIRVDNRSTGGSIFTDYTISGFQSTYSKEQSSINSTVPINSPSDFVVQYNPTGTSSVVNLGAVYKDVNDAAYSAITLEPYDGEVLIYNAALPVVNPGNWLEIKFRPVKITP